MARRERRPHARRPRHPARRRDVKPPDAVVMGEAVIHYDEIVGAADDRTLEILERRRKTATIRRRGWLIRRVLLGADVAGLTMAFVLAEALWSGNNHTGNGLAPDGELIAFIVTLPIWVLAAKLYGLYDR